MATQEELQLTKRKLELELELAKAQESEAVQPDTSETPVSEPDLTGFQGFLKATVPSLYINPKEKPTTEQEAQYLSNPYANTGIGTLSSIGNGRYYADLTQAAVANAGDIIETRFKSASTAEGPGDSVQVISLDLTTMIAQTGDSFSRLGAPVGASISVDIAGVQSDTNDIQTRLPAALTAGGNMKSDALAISGDTVAADNAESFFDGTGYAGTNNVIPVVTLVNGLAANSVNASAVAADAVTEIQAGLATSAGQATIIAGLVAINADTDDIQTRLPATLDSGLMRSQVKGMDANTVNASAVAADAVAEIQAGLATSAALATAQADITTIKSVTNNLPNSGGLTTIQSDLDDIQARLPAALVGGKMDSSVGAIAVGVDLSATMKASVNAEVVDVITVDPIAELPGITAANAPLSKQIQLLHMAIRNKNTTSTTNNKIHNSGGTPIATAIVGDTGFVFTKDEFT